MDEKFCDRLNVRLSLKGASPSDLANALGINRSTVHFWIKGKCEPKKSKIKDIADFLGVSPIWLATGKEIEEFEIASEQTEKQTQTTEKNFTLALEEEANVRRIPPYRLQLEKGIKNPVHSLQIQTDNVVSIPVVPYNVMEDEPTTIIHTIRLPSNTLQVKKPGIDLNHLEFVMVTFDTMLNSMPMGSAVLLDKSYRQLGEDGIYAFKANNRKYIMRLQLRPDGVILATQDNTTYTPMQLDLKSTEIIAKCIMVLKLDNL